MLYRIIMYLICLFSNNMAFAAPMKHYGATCLEYYLSRDIEAPVF